ncbi:uncharacterized protein BCR38DRAFT_336218 [Pseudomassariella vexata]|uniref:C2H2-type domain-containing protein n=1 Tax=Pseudomassariella vexata TaxID=1141098 RepID=A0A1Y2EAY1_9PEZI|nr:uncharacterized protein BCR38DRAFT_336218 [Pseudomassariella vexata]ORY68730.1 hypothetical protein BCR38DRAFT_336218 [Pseudomassariella vexata]
MSVVGYEPRQFIHNDAYPSMGDPEHDGGGQVRYNDHDVAVSVSELSAYNPPVPKLIPSPEPHHGLEISTPTAQPQPPTLTPAPALPATPKEDAEPRTPSRIKAIEKPVREPVKGLNGKFVCDWPNCTEESREFNRRCEWTKHMDKHDRPYRCLVEGCEKLPGFTYSGGLLRHEREVHHKHGGPKNPLNCPHPNCKRHTGKGFSRLENLNEHLRRVHTNNLDGVVSPLAAPDDSLAMVANEKVVVGTKRKAEDHDLQAEVKRLRAENERLEIQNKAQRQQQSAMMDQIASLQSELRAYRDPHLPGVPPVQMLEDNLHHF